MRNSHIRKRKQEVKVNFISNMKSTLGIAKPLGLIYFVIAVIAADKIIRYIKRTEN